MTAPAPGTSYPQVLRTTDHVWWKSVAGVLLAISMYFLLSAVITQTVIGIGWAVAGKPGEFADHYAAAIAFEKPIGMLATNLAIFSVVGVCWLLVSTVHGLKPRWLSSVRPRLHWGYLLVTLLVALLVLDGVMVLSNLPLSAADFSPQPGFWGFLVVIVLTSPLQAAAEEYLFRGYLLQAFGSLVGNPWFGVVVSALVFAFFHGVQNPALFIDRFAFGLVAGALVLKTGGLEAGIAAHVANNLSAWVLAGLTSSMAEVRSQTTLGWVDAAFDVGGFALFAVAAWFVAARFRLRTTVADTAR